MTFICPPVLARLLRLARLRALLTVLTLLLIVAIGGLLLNTLAPAQVGEAALNVLGGLLIAVWTVRP